MQTHSRQKRTVNIKHGIQKAVKRERMGEAGRKQPETSKELPAVIKEGNGS